MGQGVHHPFPYPSQVSSSFPAMNSLRLTVASSHGADCPVTLVAHKVCGVNMSGEESRGGLLAPSLIWEGPVPRLGLRGPS